MTLHAVFYDWLGGNVALFHAVNDVPGLYANPAMRAGAIVALNKLFPLYFLVIVTIAALDTIRRPRPERDGRARVWLLILLTLALAEIADVIVITALKHALYYPRPFAALPPDQVHILPAEQAKEQPLVSFPSGHSAFAVLLAASLWPVLNRWGRILGVLFVLWIMLSRLALGVHFPADVTAGALISLFVVMGTRAALLRFLPPRWRPNLSFQGQRA